MNKEQFSQWCRWFSEPTISSLSYQKKPLIMGVLNVTPNSFSDGGIFLEVSKAYERALSMVAEGVDIIDIGGESSQPGASPISVDEELARVLPLIERIRASSDVCISIDTHKAMVMREAVLAGASLINDVRALTDDGALQEAARLDVPICLMHMQGNPQTMQIAPSYDGDVVSIINDFFSQRIDAALSAGIPRHHLILDPGFGFGKTVSHNLQLLRALASFQHHQLPLLLGVSRKSTLGAILNKSVHERLIGGVALAVFAALQGVSLIRTHDVDETFQALTAIDAVFKEDN